MILKNYGKTMSVEDMRRRAVTSEDVDFIENEQLIYDSQSVFDFTSVALYIPAIQIVFSTMASCLTALILTWIPIGASNAVRTLAVASVVGLLPVIRPLRVARTRGIDALFTMIRPVVVVYLISMVIEQLGHSCEQWQAKTVGSWRELWYHFMVFIIMGSGFWRSYAPRVDDDMPLIVAGIGLLLIALVPHSAHEYGGPLCASSTIFHAVERVVRAGLFATMYCVIACAGEILMPRPNGLFVASIRACGASIWILACSVWMLPLSIVQIILVVWSRVHQKEAFEPLPLESVEGSDIESDIDSVNGLNGLNNLNGYGGLKNNGHQTHQAHNGLLNGSDMETAGSCFRVSLKPGGGVGNGIGNGIGNGMGASSTNAPTRPTKEQMSQIAESLYKAPA